MTGRESRGSPPRERGTVRTARVCAGARVRRFGGHSGPDRGQRGQRDSVGGAVALGDRDRGELGRLSSSRDDSTDRHAYARTVQWSSSRTSPGNRGFGGV
jgi:hypothetical protein